MMSGVGKKFAQVVIPSPLKDPLVYLVPSELGAGLEIGMRVLVPLGKRKVTGVVVDFTAQTSLQKVREILDVLDDRPILDAALLKLCYWISTYYVSPIGEVLATALPPLLRLESQRMVVCREGFSGLGGRLEREIYAEVEKRGRVLIKTLSRLFSGRGLYRALDRLVSIGAVEIKEKLKDRRHGEKDQGLERGPRVGLIAQPRFTLTQEQEAALQAMGERLEKGGFETYLLYGVTGSGKTEVYLRAMEAVKEQQRRSLILVPEISLTPQLLDRLCGRFPDQVGVLHSGLTPTERWTQWWRIVRGEVVVVVGTRSAVFSPVPNLGLIIVDEEHDSSYKQEEGLRYHARDLAVVRGKILGCPVLLGSATPSVESFQNCRQGRYRLHELTERVENRSLPNVEAVDLRLKAREQRNNVIPSSSNNSLFSPPLREALQENRARGQQSLIFLNRRGFASFLQCSLCGFVWRCPHCSISLTFHRKERRVSCHHCGFLKPVGDLCPGCGQRTLAGIGYGTEKIEEELLRLFPGARIGRMDRDTTRKRGSQERLIRQWERGEIEILVGTQMITKGHDVAGVTLVGVILADLSLNLPDFRAAERTFQLLSQVAGRAGRGKEPGKVIIQTFLPEHYSFQFALAHDYPGFFAAEVEFRRALNYPPFSRLVHLRFEGPSLREVEQRAKFMGQRLRRHQEEWQGAGRIEVLGPAPAPIEKLRSRYRWHILLKGRKGSPILELAKEARAIFPRGGVRLYIDVDPYHML
ncbi:MAG: primosomal protein N' [Candidatus Binatia bacterium]